MPVQVFKYLPKRVHFERTKGMDLSPDLIYEFCNNVVQETVHKNVSREPDVHFSCFEVTHLSDPVYPNISY